MRVHDIMALGKKEEVYTRLTPEEMANKSMDSRKSATERALRSENVRYKSTCDPARFEEFLEHRLTIWAGLKHKTFHATKMYDRTSEILSSLKAK